MGDKSPDSSRLQDLLSRTWMGAVQTGHGIDLLGQGLPGTPEVVLQPEPWAPPWQLEGKGPEEGGKHQKEFHPSQLVP